MTKSDQIDSYIRARLALIRAGQTVTLWDGTTYTFATDAGASVYKQQEYTEDLTQPFLVFYTGKNSVSFDGDPAPELGYENHLQECGVEGEIADTKNGAMGDALKADIAAALRGDYTLGGIAENIIGWESDSAVQIGEGVFSQVACKFTVLYTAPYGSE